VKFLVDNQLPVALCRFFQTNGHPSVHVLDNAMDESLDRDIWAFAEANDFILVSKDEERRDYSHRKATNETA
jgi:predicted nuclease of predicted toxin-antitoxin system